jgi:hypothetical protein
MIEVKVSYDRDPARALEACRWWAALALTPEQKEGIDDPIEMERVADENADQAHTRFIVSSDPDEVVARIGEYLDLGFDDVVLHAPGVEQGRFLEQFTADVMPALRVRADVPRVRYITELLVWMGGGHPWTEHHIAEQIELGDAAADRVRADVQVAEAAGLIAREGEGVQLTELGWRIAGEFGAALRSPDTARQSGRLREVAGAVVPRAAEVDAGSLGYLAEVLVWMGGDAVWSDDTVVEQVGEDHRARVVRDLAVAERLGLVAREPGGVRLTSDGWAVAGDAA